MPAHAPMPTLLLVTGPPGTGKSTLAERAAGETGGAVLGWDWVMAGLTGFGIVQAALRDLSAAEHRRVGWSIMWNVATAQIRRGCSVVLDGVARAPEVVATREVADRTGARCLVVATSCSDPELHRRRVEGRRRDIPGWHELDWDHVADVTARWQPPRDADVHLDAATPLDENVERLRRLVAAQPTTADQDRSTGRS